MDMSFVAACHRHGSLDDSKNQSRVEIRAMPTRWSCNGSAPSQGSVRSYIHVINCRKSQLIATLSSLGDATTCWWCDGMGCSTELAGRWDARQHGKHIIYTYYGQVYYQLALHSFTSGWCSTITTGRYIVRGFETPASQRRFCLGLDDWLEMWINW